MRRLAHAAVLALLAACRPDLGTPSSLVTEARLLEVVAEPPEAAPGESVRIRALVVDPGGTLDADVTWNLCLDPKPVSENNVVGTSCIFAPAPALGMGSGQDVLAALPQTGCSLFGPDTPPQIPGEPPLRPRDADITGGYYQPVRAATLGPSGQVLAAVGLVRIVCNLPNAPLAVIQDYTRRYQRNRNPTIDFLGILVGGAVSDLPTEVAAGAKLTFVLVWPAEAAEIFPVFDLQTRALVDTRESLRASWFATAGDFEADRTGRAGGDTALDSENVWTAPDAPGTVTVHFWVILRDSRGGSVATSFALEIR